MTIAEVNSTALKKEEKIKFQSFLLKITMGYDFSYSLTYGNNNREKQIIGNSIMISANTLTPKWKAGISTGYDFARKLLSHKFVSNAIY
jgi:hypothetical protein